MLVGPSAVGCVVQPPHRRQSLGGGRIRYAGSCFPLSAAEIGYDHGVTILDVGICMMRKKINISTVLAGQRLGIKELEDGIWRVSFMHYDLGYIDMEQRTLQTIDNPFGTRLSPMS